MRAFLHATRQGMAMPRLQLCCTGWQDRGGFRINHRRRHPNADPYPQQDAAIAARGAHFGLTLDRNRCFLSTAARSPYKYRRLIGGESVLMPVVYVT